MFWDMPKTKLGGSKLTREKIKEASRVIRWALNREGPHAALFSGSPASTVLLHMIREVTGEEIRVLVCHVDLLRNHLAIYQYLDKMGKLWGFKIVRERNEYLIDQAEITGDWDEFYYRHTQKTRNKMAEECRFRHLLLAEYGESRNEKFQEISLNVDFHLFEVRPLLGFKGEEVSELIKMNNLPFCPIFRETLEAEGKELLGNHGELIAVSGSDIEAEKREMASKLKSLGYL